MRAVVESEWPELAHKLPPKIMILEHEGPFSLPRRMAAFPSCCLP
jgi:hypothetical protein